MSRRKGRFILFSSGVRYQAMISAFCCHGCPVTNAVRELRHGDPMRISSSSSSRSGGRREHAGSNIRCLANTDVDGCSRRDVLWSTAAGSMATLTGGFCTFPGPAVAALVDEDVSMRVFELASPSVVSIINYKVENGVRVAQGVGTGVVWDRYGHIATNYHVISKLDKTTIPQVDLDWTK